MKKKILKILAVFVAVVMIVGLGIFANGLVGNPISKTLARKTAERHLAETYADTDFYIDHISYDFKMGAYLAYVKSKSSLDSHFALYINMNGKLARDDYENQVLSGWNTYERLNTAYRELTDTVFENPSFPENSEIAFGDLQIAGDYAVDEEPPAYGLDMKDLELDQLYDIQKLGAKVGQLTIYLDDKTVTVERAAELMLEIKRLMDVGGAPFYAMNFTLQSQKPENGIGQPEEQIEVLHFRYEDIYEEGMAERVKTASEATAAYYEKIDEQKRQEEIPAE